MFIQGQIGMQYKQTGFLSQVESLLQFWIGPLKDKKLTWGHKGWKTLVFFLQSCEL